MKAFLDDNNNDLLQENEEIDRKLKHVERQTGLVDIDQHHGIPPHQQYKNSVSCSAVLLSSGSNPIGITIRENKNGCDKNNSTTCSKDKNEQDGQKGGLLESDDEDDDDKCDELHFVRSCRSCPSSSAPLPPPSEKVIKRLFKAIKLLSARKEEAELAVKDLRQQVRTLQEEQQKQGKRPHCCGAKNSNSNTSAVASDRQRKLELDIQLLTGENQDLKKEIEELQLLVKESETKSRDREFRLKQTIKSVQNLKERLLENKNNKKSELNSHAKKEISDLKTTINALEKKNHDLLACFKKQMQLIDVLKRQKIHLEASRLLELTEKEFVSALDWKIDGKAQQSKNH
jgi:predicted  nucleic acid-binding Zn-ribbon protein